ncbi:MAG: ribonuclease [Deltaproteobacteria bacterium RIFOXYD12_FULL_57_12]|nr:MAG: ribonuclease [Deltaproteobacteria bacterium RIFOXYD12_FULL_57_12]
MDNYLMINATSYEIRIALVENGNLVEFHLEQPKEKGLVGNIYKGRVVRVLPGMQAAFVDIGLERTGFLYVDDVHFTTAQLEQRLLRNDRERSCCSETTAPELLELPQSEKSIGDLLIEGQEILVQICKEPIGTKGARLTCHITLPCRNLVFMPMTDHIGISRKIENEEIRLRLRKEIEELRPEGKGFIVRTVAAENATRGDLEADMEFLLLLWSDIQAMAARALAPSLVYEDMDITLRAVRDLFTPQTNRVLVDDPATHARVLRFVDTFIPQLRDKIYLYREEIPLFDAYGIEVELGRALEKKVWLRSGGYIVIETTEALTAIDVNTGRYVGKNDFEETLFKTNMEAVKEIAFQLRLRNIGGIIIIDFIDMEDEAHREKVFQTMQEAVKKDKSRINILKLSEFGLVQMTRKRNRDNLARAMCEPCPICDGIGQMKSRRTVCYEIFRTVTRNARKMAGDCVTLKVPPDVADIMLKEESLTVETLERETGKRFVIAPSQDLLHKKYEIIWGGA